MSFPVIDRYQIRRGLGRGAMGSVYLAFDPKIGRDVAVKVLQREYALSDSHRQRFDREARAIAALKHPNIVNIFDYGGSPDEHLFLVMEYVEGPHTGKVVREHGVLPESVLAAVGMELCAALGAAHKAGIIHRDLKPENVFLDDGRLVLADFGIVKAISEQNPLGADAANPRTDVIGTPGFMAPEQFEQDRLDERTDIFALGALLYFLASKQLPYDADSPYGLIKVFRETRPVPLIEHRPEISEQMSRLVQECLEVDPHLRPGTVEAVWQRMRDILERLGASMPRELISAFQREPTKFRAHDRRRVIDHLLERLKLAVRDEDGVAADEIRSRLAVLDPSNEEASHITGVSKLLRRVTREEDPEAVFSKASRRRWLMWGTGTFVALLGIGAWLAHDLVGTKPSEPIEPQEAATLRVRSNERTHVFLNGRALGTTPGFRPARVSSGSADMEFVSTTKRRLSHATDLVAGQRLEVYVDWKKSEVRVSAVDQPKSRAKTPRKRSRRRPR